MKKVKFLNDYRGKLTDELFYEKGTVAEFEEKVAAQLVADGRAENVKTPAVQVPAAFKK